MAGFIRSIRFIVVENRKFSVIFLWFPWWNYWIVNHGYHRVTWPHKCCGTPGWSRPTSWTALLFVDLRFENDAQNNWAIFNSLWNLFSQWKSSTCLLAALGCRYSNCSRFVIYQFNLKLAYFLLTANCNLQWIEPHANELLSAELEFGHALLVAAHIPSIWKHKKRMQPCAKCTLRIAIRNGDFSMAISALVTFWSFSSLFAVQVW